jgi:hypothetical protein
MFAGKSTIISMHCIPSFPVRELRFSLFYSGFRLQSSLMGSSSRNDGSVLFANERLSEWTEELSASPDSGETSTPLLQFQMELMKKKIVELFPLTDGNDYSNTQLRRLLGVEVFEEFREKWFRNVIILLSRGEILNDDQNGWLTQTFVGRRDVKEDLSTNSKVCFRCKKYSKHLKYCAKCVRVSYCSKECQRENWSEHKRECKPV